MKNSVKSVLERKNVGLRRLGVNQFVIPAGCRPGSSPFFCNIEKSSFHNDPKEEDAGQRPSGMTGFFDNSPSKCAEDSRVRSARTFSALSTMNKGFTLIELLVVVLIIGILAAVALPQYQKAVQKARITEVIPSLRALGHAQQVYKLANGNYTSDLSALDVAAPSFNSIHWGALILDTNGGEPHLELQALFLPYAVFFVYQLSEDKLYCSQCCTASTQKVCQRLFGEEGSRMDPSNGRYMMYPVGQ